MNRAGSHVSNLTGNHTAAAGTFADLISSQNPGLQLLQIIQVHKLILIHSFKSTGRETKARPLRGLTGGAGRVGEPGKK